MSTERPDQQPPDRPVPGEPLYVPLDFERDPLDGSRDHVALIAEDERQFARELWPDATVPEIHPMIDDEMAVDLQRHGLLLRFLPPKRLEPEMINALGYPMSRDSVGRLRTELTDTTDPFQLDGGWYVVPTSGYDVKYFDGLRGFTTGDDWPVKPPSPRAMDLLYAQPELRDWEIPLISGPRLPKAIELLYLANTLDPADRVPSRELCRDPLTVSERDTTRLLDLHFTPTTVRLYPVRTIDVYFGKLRPIWRIADRQIEIVQG